MSRKDPQVVLTENERAVLHRIKEIGNRYEVARARLFLLSDKGVQLEHSADQVGLSHQRARYWLRKFAQKRLNTFGENTLMEVQVIPKQATESKPKQKTGKKRKQPRAKASESESRSSNGKETEPQKEQEPETPIAAQDRHTEAQVALTQTPPQAIIETPRQTEHEDPAALNEANAPAEIPSPQNGEDEPRRALRLDEAIGVRPDDSMLEAGHKVLFYYFERVLYNEPGARLGEDIEALHDMRTSARRLRAAFRVFREFYRGKAIRPYRKSLGALGQVLGTARDLDVFMENMQRYREGLPEADRAGMAPLEEAWREKRAAAHTEMTRHLDSKRFARFVEDFAAFLEKSAAGRRKTSDILVRHAAPRLIYARFEAVRRYDTLLDNADLDTLHALRMQFKRLRYTLEFFQEVLGPEAETVITAARAMQDHLGALNDANVAGHFLQKFVVEYEAQQAHQPIAERRSIEQVIQYMADRAAEKHNLIVSFPDAWAEFNGEPVRRSLALAVAAL